ncbi:hypothetical protein J2Z62_000571 [Mycoplasmoides fastidiosum]|uniref:Uncharacterized protein n=1 Tax=Mycoplasmoides fastidiosum TaxID=92758 RepID=A0ABU0LZK0_9BACT|nr:DUF1600 domain-containing protein [Mycoplasmoides fastidiosum]MDQ0514133.1 hypothetical protein [Mycoplasmoides fastidiosum]UUD37459.1 DUF1600 domain-containing protein [Mycoplasmoides fastidiosum]
MQFNYSFNQLKADFLVFSKRIKFALTWKDQHNPYPQAQQLLTSKQFGTYKLLNSLGLGFMLLLIGFSSLTILRGIIYPENNYTLLIWWTNLGTFTTQSNLLITFFFSWYFFKPASKIFKNYYVIVTILSYISVTFIGYNFFIGLRSNYATWTSIGNNMERIDSSVSIWNHVIAPILAVAYWLADAKHFVKIQAQSVLKNQLFGFGKLVIYGLIYPLVFLIYSLLVSLVGVYVVYNGFTNLNPNLGYDSVARIAALKNTDGSLSLFSGANDGATNLVGSNQNLSPELLMPSHYTFGRPFNIIFYVLFLLLFALFLFLFQVARNQFFFADLKGFKKQFHYRKSLKTKSISE